MNSDGTPKDLRIDYAVAFTHPRHAKMSRHWRNYHGSRPELIATRQWEGEEAPGIAEDQCERGNQLSFYAIAHWDGWSKPKNNAVFQFASARVMNLEDAQKYDPRFTQKHPDYFSDPALYLYRFQVNPWLHDIFDQAPFLAHVFPSPGRLAFDWIVRSACSRGIPWLKFDVIGSSKALHRYYENRWALHTHTVDDPDHPNHVFRVSTSVVRSAWQPIPPGLTQIGNIKDLSYRELADKQLRLSAPTLDLHHERVEKMQLMTSRRLPKRMERLAGVRDTPWRQILGLTTLLMSLPESWTLDEHPHSTIRHLDLSGPDGTRVRSTRDARHALDRWIEENPRGVAEHVAQHPDVASVLRLVYWASAAAREHGGGAISLPVDPKLSGYLAERAVSRPFSLANNPTLAPDNPIVDAIRNADPNFGRHLFNPAQVANTVNSAGKQYEIRLTR